MSFTLHQENHLLWLSAPILQGVCHGFSTRQGGVSQSPLDTLNLGMDRGDAPEALLENYSRFCGALNLDPERTVLSKQVHETNVRLCTETDAGKGLLRPRDYQADALISNTPGLALTVFSADCGLVLLYDPIHEAVGALHAGWRGCAGGIVQNTVQAMGTAFDSRPEDLLAAIGPCIGKCCFETDSDVPSAMRRALGQDAEPFLDAKEGDKWQVDLGGLNRLWLLRSGLREEHIQDSGLCTACHPELFWSHRKMGEARGLQVGMIAAGPASQEAQA